MQSDVVDAPLLRRVLRHFGKPEGRTKEGTTKKNRLFLPLATKWVCCLREEKNFPFEVETSTAD